MQTRKSFIENLKNHGNLRLFQFGTLFAEYWTTPIFGRQKAMYDRKFFQTQLGKAALASIAAMSAFVVFSSQIVVSTPTTAMAVYNQVEIA